MNKSQLIEKIAEGSDESKATVGRVLDQFMEVVGDQLSEGEIVQLVGFGTFKVNERAARTGRNPQTGEEMQIAAAKVPAFSAGKPLKEKVNK